MARVGELDAELGRVAVAHLADHHDVGVVAEDEPERLFHRELVADLDLAHAGQHVLHRVLGGEDVARGRADLWSAA